MGGKDKPLRQNKRTMTALNKHLSRLVKSGAIE